MVKIGSFEVTYKEFFRCPAIQDEHVVDFGASLCEFQKGLRVMQIDFAW